MFDAVIFGEKLRNHRKVLSLTQEEVADKIGVSGQAVSKWENGECLPDCYNLKLLGEIYNVSLDILLETENISDNNRVTEKIKQLATEYVWNKMSRDQREEAHKELGDDLWEMWKAIYYVEIGNRELQQREMKHANCRISGEYGTKVWDDNGVACVVKSKLKNQLGQITVEDMEILRTLLSDNYFKVLSLLDCHYPKPKSVIINESGLEEPIINEIIIYLTENRIIEHCVTPDKRYEGYKFTAYRGIIVYMLLAASYLLTKQDCSTSEYCIY
jgi:transcriptional regulator with XRE-family HTH domain